jgi:NADPH-dependent 2,4-dienoyl-CoA reductase/sulfur reductase-like enzyme/rhodanese-related sulfurtransferase
MKLVVVGGVAGGASAAARARRLSEEAEIVLFERGEYISFANCGLPYHVGGAIASRDSLLVMTPQRFRERTGIDVRVRQEVLSIDRGRRLLSVRNHATGERYDEPYDRLILATGSTPVRPSLPGADDPAVSVLWTLPDMDGIKERVDGGARRAVVVGGGFLGLEAAENLRLRGVEVTLVEALPQVLPTMDPEMAQPLAEEARRNGVALLRNVSVSAIRRRPLPAGGDGEVDVVLSDGRILPADLAVFAVGVRPNASLAAAAGLATGLGGAVVVDEELRTSDPAVFAVGDVIQVTDSLGRPARIPLAGPANRQGRLAAGNALGGHGKYRATYGTSVVKLFSLAAAATGATERTLAAAAIPFEKVYLHPWSHATYYPGAEMMHLKLLFDREGRILGAQAVGGEGVDKRIDVIATAMQAGLTVRDLCDLELAYAPPFGSAKDPVNFAGYVASNVLDGKSAVVHADAVPEGALLLDVRDSSEHAAGAIPGSRLVPLGSLRKRLGELPADREIVAYCAVGIRGYLAERILSQNGFRARNLSGGIVTWEMYHPCSTPPHGKPVPASGEG